MVKIQDMRVLGEEACLHTKIDTIITIELVDKILYRFIPQVD